MGAEIRERPKVSFSPREDSPGVNVSEFEVGGNKWSVEKTLKHSLRGGITHLSLGSNFVLQVDLYMVSGSSGRELAVLNGFMVDVGKWEFSVSYLGINMANALSVFEEKREEATDKTFKSMTEFISKVNEKRAGN